jgi:phosphoglycerol geranylgeranyltransferase
MTGPVFTSLLEARRMGRRLLWLLDPDKIDSHKPDPRWQRAEEFGVAAILVGTSQDGNPDFDRTIASIRTRSALPLILFPGSASQVSPHVDAVLFLMLLSGRNPDYLVGEQVKGAPLVREYGIEPIPTGYLLIDTGTTTSVVTRSSTAPLPQHDVSKVCDHALCAEYMGQSLVYLEAGSGASHPIGAELIVAVRRTIRIPLLVGGGIKTAEQCQQASMAGADFVVVGTALEQDRSAELLRQFCVAARGTPKAVSV